MGWSHDRYPGHEGYIVGPVPDDQRTDHWRELATGDKECRVERMKVGCDCGWRSRAFFAGLKAKWYPNITELGDDELEDSARAEWHRHLEVEARRERDEQAGAPLRRLIPSVSWT